MARQQVVQITCGRCTRVEHRPLSDLPALEKQAAIFRGEFRGEKIEFEDLCDPCQAIVEGHWKEIVKTLKKMSPAHKGKPDEEA